VAGAVQVIGCLAAPGLGLPVMAVHAVALEHQAAAERAGSQSFRSVI
jgi:hypothetical protein